MSKGNLPNVATSEIVKSPRATPCVDSGVERIDPLRFLTVKAD